MENSIHIQGRFTKEPEITSNSNGTLCCAFTLANERKKGETNFIKCFAWGKLTDVIRQYCHKGTMIIVDGYMKYRTWEGTRGKQEGLDLMVEKIHFCGGYQDNTYTPQNNQHQSETSSAPKSTEDFEEITDDELPF